MKERSACVPDYSFSFPDFLIKGTKGNGSRAGSELSEERRRVALKVFRMQETHRCAKSASSFSPLSFGPRIFES